MNKITRFDDFKVVSNKQMKAVIAELNRLNVQYESAEDPTMDEDGFIELSEKTHLAVSRDGQVQCGIEDAQGEFIFGKKTTSVQEALDELDELRRSGAVTESNYQTGHQTEPTPDLLSRRIKKVDKAVELLESALSCLNAAPKLDDMDDIPKMIEGLRELIGDGESGIKSLLAIYRKKI